MCNYSRKHKNSNKTTDFDFQDMSYTSDQWHHLINQYLHYLVASFSYFSDFALAVNRCYYQMESFQLFFSFQTEMHALKSSL
uniref:Uncharacterized protein n=1 Tax=Rhizophora mucronata TaxID=61149 RepID=A0A2P2KL91_RHIMU